MKLDARSFKVDFRKDAEERWDELLTDPWARRQSQILCRATHRYALKEIKEVFRPFGRIAPLVHKAAGLFAKVVAGEFDYYDDMLAWSQYAVGDLEQVVLANFSYEALKTGHGARNALAWCTAVAFDQPALGMVHCRNLDWPIWQIKKATVILDCKSEAGPFKAVSVPGLVGVLSGVAKGRFSITLNSKDDLNHSVPNLKAWSAPLLLRWILENCGSYDEALRELKRAPAFVPFYVMIVGPKKGQAAVVEVNTRERNRVYRQTDYPVAVANHYPGETSDEEDWENTLERQELIEAGALRCRAKTLAGLFSVNNEVLYSNTVQSMILHPRTGTVLLQEL